MSAPVSQSRGVTVMTLNFDQSSSCPPLCQLLGALCYSPALFSQENRLTPHRAGAQAALGALWIITGLLQIGLAVFLSIISPYMGDYLYFNGCFPVWMGVLFLFFGVTCILAERHPRPIFVLLSGLLNLAGVALSITAIVLFSQGIDGVWYKNTCSGDPHTDYVLLQRCKEARELRWNLLSSVNAVSLTLFILDLCLGLSSAIISFKTLKHGTEGSGTKPLLKETPQKS